jgi:hypothetical protein
MLGVVSDREVAKQAARMNVSALLLGQPRIVPQAGRLSAERLRDAVARGGEDLSAIRRSISGLLERTAPGMERVRVPLDRDLGPER